MPASTLDPVNAALRTSLSKNNSDSILDSQIAGSTKRALLSNIEFEYAGSYHSSVLDKLKSKYIVLKSTEAPQPSKPEEDMSADETLKLAKYELFPLESVQLGWTNYEWSIGCGMINMGNTCYLNSTLQALFHVPALVNWLMSDKEHTECQESGVLCIICAMKKTLQESQQRNTNSIRPLLIYNKLRLVCRTFMIGRQEDAHEFLRYLVEAMEKAYLTRFRNHAELDIKIKETTPLNQIFGGYLRSAVHCLDCGHISTTFQHFQDLLLDIRKAQNLDEALEGYFSREKLDDDSYYCESCRKKVPATKQFSLKRAPMVLCIQLKRFSVSNTKISKHISFRQRLDLTKFARHRPNVPLIYRLVALVTHMGPTVNCGHYTAVAQAATGNYYQFDDSTVRPISHQGVFNTNAYIMLYELESSPFPQQKGTVTNIKHKLPTSTNDNEIPFKSTKSTHNGIGYTSCRVYGPELPPKKSNGDIATSTTISNGNGKHPATSSSPSDSDSDSDTAKKVQTDDKSNVSPVATPKKSVNSSDIKPHKQSTAPTKLQNRTIPFSPPFQNSTVAPSVSAASTSSSSAPSDSPKKTKTEPPAASQATTIAKLVPYETDDSSNSEDSTQHAVKEGNGTSRISTNLGEWKVTSTTADASYEPSSTAPTTTTTERSWQKNGNNNANKSQNDTTVSELFKMSHSGYSAPVASWNGTRARLDKEVSNERREERKRPLSEMMDATDQGRVKHPKVHNNNNFKSNPGYNPIQEYHNAKNWNQNSGSRYFTKQYYNTGNRHRRNNNNNYHHKNKYHNNNNNNNSNSNKNFRYRQS